MLTLRSCHLPRDHTLEAAEHHAVDRCSFCGRIVVEEVGNEEYTTEERRWRKVQHRRLCGCDRRLYETVQENVRTAPTIRDLRDDLLDAPPAPHTAAKRAAFASDVHILIRSSCPCF